MSGQGEPEKEEEKSGDASDNLGEPEEFGTDHREHEPAVFREEEEAAGDVQFMGGEDENEEEEFKQIPVSHLQFYPNNANGSDSDIEERLSASF